MKQRLCNCKFCRHGRKHKGNSDVINKHKRADRAGTRQSLRTWK